MHVHCLHIIVNLYNIYTRKSPHSHICSLQNNHPKIDTKKHFRRFTVKHNIVHIAWAVYKPIVCTYFLLKTQESPIEIQENQIPVQVDTFETKRAQMNAQRRNGVHLIVNSNRFSRHSL